MRTVADHDIRQKRQNERRAGVLHFTDARDEIYAGEESAARLPTYPPTRSERK